MPIPALREMSAEQVDYVIGHPAQANAVEIIADLIVMLRSCQTPADYDYFQRVLFGHVIDADEHNAAVNRTRKRLADGKLPDGDAPDLPSGADSRQRQTWDWEYLTFERIGRQLRAVGDALAWQALDYHRELIFALSRNQRPGPMAGKAGLTYELGRVEHIWKDRGRFALLHDLTNCLRIGDYSEIVGPGNVLVGEVKKGRNRNPEQKRRLQAAVDAVMDGGPFPDDPDARIVGLSTPHRTHLAALSDACILAEQRGIVGMIVPSGGRSLVCAATRKFVKDHADSAGERWTKETLRTRLKLRLPPGSHCVSAMSADRANRDTGMAPFGVFPIPASHAAQLICDFLVFEVFMSYAEVGEAAERVGLSGHLLRPPVSEMIPVSKKVYRLQRGTQTLDLTLQAIERVLLEFTDLNTLVEGVVELFDTPGAPLKPHTVLADERRTWRHHSNS